MAKYIFTAPYTIGTPELTSKQGVVTPATTIKVFKVGDIIEGTFNTNTGGVYNPNPAKWVEINISGQVYPIPYNLVKEYTGTGSTTNTSSPANKTQSASSPANKTQSASSPANKTQSASMFTPKNIFIGVLAIGAIFGILKLTKVI